MNKRLFVLSAAAAGILAASAAHAAPATEKSAEKTGPNTMGECHGINSCKGKSQCGGGDSGHDCGGKNECKGKGWVRMSKKNCDAKKGTWEAFKMEM